MSTTLKIVGTIIQSVDIVWFSECQINLNWSAIFFVEPLWDMLVQRNVSEAVNYLLMESQPTRRMDLLQKKISGTQGKTILHIAAKDGDKNLITKLLFTAKSYRNSLLKITDHNGFHPDHYASDREVLILFI